MYRFVAAFIHNNIMFFTRCSPFVTISVSVLGHMCCACAIAPETNPWATCVFSRPPRIRVYMRPCSKHYIAAGLSTNNEWGRKNVDDATSPNAVYALKKNSQIIFTPTVSTCLVHTLMVNVLYM